MIVAPNKQFLINVKLNNPAETATLYVQAVIKHAITGSILATVNLDDQGGYYFSKLWTTPNDTSLTGLQVVIFKTVYTDASYTTISTDYGASIDNIVIQQIPALTVGGFTREAGKPAESIDYKRIQKMIDDSVSNVPIIEPREVNIGEIKKLIAYSGQQLIEAFMKADQNNSFRIAEINDDFARRVGKMIKDAKPEINIPEVDLSAIQELVSIVEKQSKEIGSLKQSMKDIESDYMKMIDALVEKLKPVVIIPEPTKTKSKEGSIKNVLAL